MFRQRELQRLVSEGKSYGTEILARYRVHLFFNCGTYEVVIIRARVTVMRVHLLLGLEDCKRIDVACRRRTNVLRIFIIIKYLPHVNQTSLVS